MPVEDGKDGEAKTRNLGLMIETRWEGINNAVLEPDPGRNLKSQKVEFLHEKYTVP